MKGIKELVLVAVSLMLGAVVGIGAGFAQSAGADREDEAIASAPPDTPAAGHARQHDPMASTQKRLAHLKSKLGITAEQEPQWSAFSDTVMQRVAQLKSARRGEKPAALTAPQRIDRRLAWMKERTAAFEAMGEAAKALYATLSPQEQQIADEKLMRWHHRQHG
jgi:hypothetical protein